MLFNKDGAGSAEMKSLLGFIYKSIKFENLTYYISFAERDIKNIISKAVMDVAQDHYISENYKLIEPDEDHPEYTILDELVTKIQFPVAVHAYRRFVPSNDLTHSDKGRQIFVSNEEKPAFEWMIDKDNQNLLDLANEATDLLLEFLDEHVDDTIIPPVEENEDPLPAVLLIPWATSNHFIVSKQLFINNAREFDLVFAINSSRRVYITLLPFIKHVQLTIIRPCLTDDQYEGLLDEVMNQDIPEDSQIIIDLIRQPLGLLALSMAIRRLSVELLPDGLFTSMVGGVVRTKQATAKIDRNEVAGLLEKDAQKQLGRLQEYLRKLSLIENGEAYEPIDHTERIDEDQKYVRL